MVNKAGLRFEDQSIGIRDERYKLSYFWGQAYLFDLKNDPKEKVNLHSSHPDLVASLRAELVRWFDGIKAEPGAFGSPLFLVGKGGKVQSMLLAYGPTRVGGNVQNHNYDLNGLSRPGDFAEYRLRVLTPGETKIGLAYDAPNGPAQASLALEISGAGAQNVTPREKWWVESAPLTLPQGDLTLRITLKSGADPFERLREIYLTRTVHH